MAEADMNQGVQLVHPHRECNVLIGNGHQIHTFHSRRLGGEAGGLVIERKLQAISNNQCTWFAWIRRNLHTPCILEC